MSSALELFEYEVEHADAGAKALRTFSTFHPDVLLIDRWLPDGDGTVFVASLRSSGFAGVVVMMTGDGRPETRSRALECGANHFLLKPFEVESLVALLG